MCAEEVPAVGPTTAGTVVLFNASYEPMGRVSFKHAVRMLVRQVAVVHEPYGERMIGPYPWPNAVRLVRYVAATWLHRPAGWTKRGVLARDRHRCAYCRAHAATIDHVVPRSRGGDWSWQNTVAACTRCNERKGNRTPAEARMRLLIEPWHPTRAQLLTT
jgi:5-methylcytosine-specific restriction endonuclease McrA